MLLIAVTHSILPPLVVDPAFHPSSVPSLLPSLPSCYVPSQVVPSVLDPLEDLPPSLRIPSRPPPDIRTPELAELLLTGDGPSLTPLQVDPISLTGAAAVAHAQFPLQSTVVPFAPLHHQSLEPILHDIQPLQVTFNRARQRRFLQDLDARDDRIRARLEQPFGKDNLSQFLYVTPELRHVLLPLWKSGFLYDCRGSCATLRVAYKAANTLGNLLDEYGDVDFNPIRGYNPHWDTETEVNTHRANMVTASLLHFNGSAADTVRWIGGPHVAHHRDHLAILHRLRHSKLCASTYADISRILLRGIPNRCQAFSSAENFEAFYSYGNHATVEAEPEKTYQAMVKDNRKGYTLLFDQRLVPFLLHCHVTPQGVVDLDTPYKKPRPIFDSSFRPAPWCHSINDWTDKKWEPPLTFAGAEMAFMIWVYNLRVTYPADEIYLADDDVSGAFRQLKYHPNLVAMHTSIQCGFGCLNTGATFGDNTSPSNFDPCGLCRRHLSRHLWLTCGDICQLVEPHLPPITTAPPPTPGEIQAFARADPCLLNTGVLDPLGNRVPPPFPMHVDDALYADVLAYLRRTVCASAGGLFEVFGWPTNPLVPSPLSMDKLETDYNHLRKMVGRLFNSRTLTVGMLPYKREQLLQLLTTWVTKPKYTLLEIATLLGILENHTRYARWARCWYFALQNTVRRHLDKRYYALKRIKSATAVQERVLRAQLPASLMHRLGSLLARHKAKLLWHEASFAMHPDARRCLYTLLRYVQDTSSPWATHLGLVVPRTHHFQSFGDASLTGGGAYCPELQFWFEVVWSPRVARGCRLRPKDTGFIHINCLEFIVVILQLAAILVRLETLPPVVAALAFPHGIPSIPVWLGRTDNLVSRAWEVKATSRSDRGQSLVAIYSELLRLGRVHTMCTHVAGKLNVVADDISRNDYSSPFPSRSSQLFLKHPLLRSFSYFRPSPDLLQLLTLGLFSVLAPTQFALPKNLGHFAPDSSTTFDSVVI